MSMFFDDALGKVKNVADAAGRKTSDLVEFSKLKVALTDLNRELNRRYMSLGKLTYENAMLDDSDDQAAELIHEIDELHTKISSIHDRILAIKNIVRCPECSAINPRNAIFCNQCGVLIKASSAASEESPDETPVEELVEEIAEELSIEE